jgi:hypothetical protein
MGMYDESWCASCGKGMHYTTDENAECGECVQSMPDKLINLIEYIKIHKISKEQDWELAKDGAPLKDDEYDPSDDYFEGAIDTMEHILSVATDILNGDIQGKGY